MKHLRNIVLVTTLLGLPSLTFGQTIFDVTGTLTLANGSLAGTAVGSFSGTIHINTTTGDIVSWNFSMPSIPAYPGYAAVGAFTFSPSDSTSSFLPSTVINPGAPGYLTISNGQYQVTFAVPNALVYPGVAGPVSFSGGPNGSDYAAPGAGFSIAGTITPSPVPEPSAVVLVGSGLLGILGFRRKLFEMLQSPRSTQPSPAEAGRKGQAFTS